ncbi:MAG: hypothetical protein IT443_01050 [Phycisphaeraceae bacterium]|nr:hypothetical protein [Phycisphaeraceae bacterium]
MPRIESIVTVTLNTAVDRVLQVPGLAVGGHLKGRRVSRYPAGKGINVSRALQRLGVGSVATGWVGENELAEFEAFLRAGAERREDEAHSTLRDDVWHPSADSHPGAGVDSQLLPVRGSTRENITLIDPQRHTDLHVREEGFAVTAADLERMRDRLGELSRPGTVVAFCGSVPAGMGAEELADLVEVAGAGGGEVALDLGGELLRQVLALSPGTIWLVKPNAQELGEVLGQAPAADLAAAVAQAKALTKKVSWVAVTLGADGAVLVGREGQWGGCLPIPASEVCNTVGCGDCFLAGVLAAAARSQDPADMLRRGLAVAAANTLEPGAAMFDSKRVTELERKVEVVIL